MFLVKVSICAYLMALNFGRSYRLLIWVSVVIVVLCNFIMMLILHFAYCRPYYSRWDFTVQGECWPVAVSEATAFVQIASNIFTDLVSTCVSFPFRLNIDRSQIYAAAPIVYLRHVQLSKQTQWDVRIVFSWLLCKWIPTSRKFKNTIGIVFALETPSTIHNEHHGRESPANTH